MKINPNTRYVVTQAKGSSLLKPGNHFKMDRDGVVHCREFKEWIEESEVGEVFECIEAEPDKQWALQEAFKLRGRLSSLITEYDLDRKLIKL